MPFGRDEQGAWKGFQLWRPDFDAILLNGANRAGAMIVRPCGELRPIVEDNRVAGVETSTGSWRCAFVIDATGRQRWLTRTLNLEIEIYGPPRVAWFNYAEGECSFIDRRNPMIVSDVNGLTWIARVRPNVYQWVRLPLQGARPPNEWCPVEFDGLRSMGRRRGIDVSSSIANPTAGPGYFLAGDAASIVDPLSSHGILKALMSGMKAAHHSATVLRYGVNPWQLRAYTTTGSRGGFVRTVPASVSFIALLAAGPHRELARNPHASETLPLPPGRSSRSSATSFSWAPCAAGLRSTLGQEVCLQRRLNT